MDEEDSLIKSLEISLTQPPLKGHLIPIPLFSGSRKGIDEGIALCLSKCLTAFRYG